MYNYWTRFVIVRIFSGNDYEKNAEASIIDDGE